MPKVLIVDDEPAIVQLMEFILKKSGYEVDVAQNGQQALAVLGVEPLNDTAVLPDVVMLDVMMPIMDGHTACLRISEHARTAKLPVIIVTAKGDMRQLFEKVPSVAAFFYKPFDPGTLRAAVAKALTTK